MEHIMKDDASHSSCIPLLEKKPPAESCHTYKGERQSQRRLAGTIPTSSILLSLMERKKGHESCLSEKPKHRSLIQYPKTQYQKKSAATVHQSSTRDTQTPVQNLNHQYSPTDSFCCQDRSPPHAPEHEWRCGIPFSE